MNKFDPYQNWLGIQHSNHPVDYYQLLGLKRFETDLVVIEAAVARRFAFMQDVAQESQHVEATRKILNEIALARLCLTDTEKRSKYDQQLATQTAKSITHTPKAPPAQAPPAKVPPAKVPPAKAPPAKAPPAKVPTTKSRAAKASVARTKPASPAKPNPVAATATRRTHRQKAIFRPKTWFWHSASVLLLSGLALASFFIVINNLTRDVANPIQSEVGLKDNAISKDTTEKSVPGTGQIKNRDEKQDLAAKASPTNDQRIANDVTTERQAQEASPLKSPGQETTAPQPAVPLRPGNEVSIVDPLSERPASGSTPKSATKFPVTRTFDNFADHVELPPLNDVSGKKIDSLVFSNRFLMGASLFAPKEATRNKLSFAIRRSDNDKQRWIVAMQKRGSDPPIDIASFWRTETEFFFQWLPAAQHDEDANYLRNSALKLEIPNGQSTWLSLRSPILIDGFRLKEDQSLVTVKQELPWLPTSKSIVVEIQPFAYREILSHCAPEYVTKSPGVMYFSQHENEAFVWLEVSATRRAEYSLQAELKVRIQGAAKPLKPNEIIKYKRKFSEIAKAAKEKLAATKNKDTQKQISTFVKSAETTSRIFGEYSDTMSKLYKKDIPVAIYMKIENHRVLIAKTPGITDF